ncbi:MAG: hypothetical protein COS29_01100 [Candidatus Omnitrophica bacterium CG02_land_8_20_14_3_00__42_8]|nr:MAG: hypothetical protein COS29_01100 [Candidatus Omnitrophica bacterium CG02_land_8_20_14_3_00__42_8]
MKKYPDSYFNIFYFWKIFYSHAAIFLLLIVLGASAGILKAKMTPAIYRSSVMLLLSGSFNNFGAQALKSNSFSSSDTVILIVKSLRMRDDIVLKFPKTRFHIDAYKFRNAIIMEVNTRNPEFSRDIANFCVSNMNKINNELHITTDNPMVRVLDFPDAGISVSNNPVKGVIAGGLFALIAGIIYLFAVEYGRYLSKYAGA